MNDLIIDNAVRKMQIKKSKKTIKEASVIVANKMAKLERRMIIQNFSRREINLACINMCEQYDVRCKKQIIKENFLTGIASQLLPGVGDYFKRVFLEYLLTQLGIPPTSDLGIIVIEALKNVKYSQFMEYFQSGNCPMVTDLICNTIADYGLTKLAQYVQNSMAQAKAGTATGFSQDVGGFLTSAMIPDYLQDFIENSAAGKLNVGSAIFEILKEQIKNNLLPGLKKEVARLICGQDMQSFSKHLAKAAQRGSSKESLGKENQAAATEKLAQEELEASTAKPEPDDKFSNIRAIYKDRFKKRER